MFCQWLFPAVLCLNLVEMFKYFPDLNDLSIAMGKLDKSGEKTIKDWKEHNGCVYLF